MTVAAIDRLIHQSTIFELDPVESYRSKEAARQQKIRRDNGMQQAKSARQIAGSDRPRCSTRSSLVGRATPGVVTAGPA